MKHYEDDDSAVTVSERRIERKARALQIAAVLCALFAAAGIAHGLHEGNPDGGWLMPGFAGIVAATAFASFWHVSIGSMIGMVRMSMIIALFVGAVGLTGVALGASAQAIATAISGRSALAAELGLRIDDYSRALADAYAEATGWRSVASTANAKATGFEMQAETESGGGNGTGKGCGPRCSSLRDIAAAFRASQNAMDALLASADEDRKRGEIAMTAMRDAAARGDQDAFVAAASDVTAIIARLNVVDPRPIIEHTGAVTVSDKGINLTTETEEFHAEAEKALAERKKIEGPVFMPISRGEATRSQMFGSALHGWVLAGAIDVLPLIFLALTFVLSREVWLQERIERRKLTDSGRNRRDRERAADLTNGSNVVRMKAGE